MKMNMRRAIAVTCAFGALLAPPAKAVPPKKSKVDASAPVPAEPNLNWKRLTVTLGAPHIEGGTVPQIEPALQKLNTPLSMCYSRSIVHGARFRGTADLTLRLNANGSISNARVAPPEGKGLAQDIVLCWSNAARAAHFERPSAEGVTVAFEIQFSPEQGPAEPPEPKAKYWGPVTISMGDVIASGAPLPDVSRVIAGWRSTIKPCADLARGTADGAADGTLGRVRVGVTVAADGKVSKLATLAEVTAGQSQPDPPMTKAIACVLERAKSLHFAPHADGEAQLRIGVEFTKP